MVQICEPDMRNNNNKKTYIIIIYLLFLFNIGSTIRAGFPNEDRVAVRDATLKVTIINLFDHETVTCQLGFTTSKRILLNKAPFSSQ